MASIPSEERRIKAAFYGSLCTSWTIEGMRREKRCLAKRSVTISSIGSILRCLSDGGAIFASQTVTPLSFTCSPELLTPERGKKIGLLQVAKKALLPKLGATKLDPP